MPYGDKVIEIAPDACPSGHPWPFPRPRGQAAPMLVGTQPCNCAGSSGHGHRTYHCETPGCPTPWTLRPACTDPQRDALGIFRHRA